MKLDLSTVSNTTREERIAIASLMHAMVVDALFRETDWLASDAVFHGGTSLSVVRDSIRFSEDLDFMITRESAEGLERAVRKVRDRIALTLTSHYPGCGVDLRGPKGGEVSQWTFVWSHPNKRGNVSVKAEFLITSADLLAGYASTHIVPNGRRLVSVRAQVPVPEFVSAWADKVKAIATRPAFKWRDAYDIAYIAQCMLREEAVSDGERLRAIRATAAIYGTPLSRVLSGLEQVVESGVLSDLERYEADMALWFDRETFDGYKRRAMFTDQLALAEREVLDAIALVPQPVPGMKP